MWEFDYLIFKYWQNSVAWRRDETSVEKKSQFGDTNAKNKIHILNRHHILGSLRSLYSYNGIHLHPPYTLTSPVYTYISCVLLRVMFIRMFSWAESKMLLIFLPDFFFNEAPKSHDRSRYFCTQLEIKSDWNRSSSSVS